MDILSATEIKYLDRSPAHFIAQRNNPKMSSSAMIFGTAVHTAILQPDDFTVKYTVMDDTKICEEIGGAKPRLTNAYKVWRDNFFSENAGMEIIEENNYISAVNIANAIKSHSIAAAMIAAKGDIEKRLNWKHTGIDVTGQPDKVILPCEEYPNGMIVDIKTCQDSRLNAFRNAIWGYKYHLQSAAYVEAVEESTGYKMPFTFIAIESENPYGIGTYELEEYVIDYGLSEIDRLIRLYGECLKQDIWNGYSQELAKIELPAFADITSNW